MDRPFGMARIDIELSQWYWYVMLLHHRPNIPILKKGQLLITREEKTVQAGGMV